SRARMLRALASAMVYKGCDPAELTSIQVLVELERVRIGLRFIHDRIGGRKTTHIRNFANMICTVAQHWVRVPDEQLEKLKAIRRNVDPGQSGMTDKNRATLRHFQDEHLVDRFLSLPERVWRRHRDRQALTTSLAVDLQVALAV